MKFKKRKRVTRAAVAVEPLAYTIIETARLLSCGRSLVYEEVRRGNLDLRKVGKASRITAASIHRLLAGGV
jgi:excisionase family DNA binding protein